LLGPQACHPLFSSLLLRLLFTQLRDFLLHCRGGLRLCSCLLYLPLA
jgi:hypothetical protein